MPVVHEVRAPTVEQSDDLLKRIITRIVKSLRRQLDLTEEEGRSYPGEIDADRALTPLQAACCTHRIAVGARRADGAALTNRAGPRLAAHASAVRQHACD